MSGVITAFCGFSVRLSWALGVILTLVGSFSLFSSWATIGGSRYYWAAFLGLPLIAVGSAFTQSENLTPLDVEFGR